MFNRKPDRSVQPTNGPPQIPGARPAAPRRATAAASVIGADLSIAGDLESSGEVQIDGELQGDVRAARILVGEQALISGALIADEIVVHGTVQGSIRGNQVTFRAASRVEGDVYHKSLTIEQGAYFEGKSRRTNDPMSVPPSTNGLATHN